MMQECDFRHNPVLAGDVFAEPVAKVSLGLAKGTPARILSAVLNWKGFSFLVWSVNAEAFSDSDSVLSDTWLEHDPAFSVNAKGARPQGLWNDRLDIGKGSSLAKQGMVQSIWQEI